MVVSGDGDDFEDNLEEELGIKSEDMVGFKKFLQTVENMELEINNLVTYIS